MLDVNKLKGKIIEKGKTIDRHKRNRTVFRTVSV